MGFFGQQFGSGGLSALGNNQGALASGQMGQGQQLFGQSQGINSMLTPFLENQLTNPQGFGATALAQMGTQAGQATAGGVGAGMKTAMDIGSRTGNTAAVPGMLANIGKAGAKTAADNATNLMVQNQMQKMQQQQGATGALQGMAGEALKGSESSYGLANEAYKNQEQTLKDAQAADKAGFQSLMKMGMGAMTGGASLMAGGGMSGMLGGIMGGGGQG